MEDRELWEYLDAVEKVPPSADFRAGFWTRVEKREQRVGIWLKELIPALAVAAVFLVLTVPVRHILTGRSLQKFFPSQTGFSGIDLVEESVRRLGVEEVAVQTLMPEEILDALAPVGLTNGVGELNKGGELL